MAESATDADKPDAPKNKLVRDSFTIPKAEYAVLNELKQRATRLTQPAKKSEILRAGIQLLRGLSDAAFLAALAAVPNLKTGRPPKEGEAAQEPGDKLKRHVKDKTAPKAARAAKAGGNGAAAPAAKAERVAARAARAAAKPRAGRQPGPGGVQKAERADKPAKALSPEKQAAKAAKQAAKGRSTT
jgi:hypothetical protein